jgi:hypothetical protein
MVDDPQDPNQGNFDDQGGGGGGDDRIFPAAVEAAFLACYRFYLACSKEEEFYFYWYWAEPLICF